MFVVTCPSAFDAPVPNGLRLPEKLAFLRLLRVQKPMTRATTTSIPPVATKPPVAHEALLSAVGARQDRLAFATLFEYYAPRVKSYLMKHGADESAAEEILQNTFVTIWEKAASYNPQKAAASTWIFTIARNKRIDALRREKYIEVNSDAPALAQASQQPDEDYTDWRALDTLSHALKELPPEQATLLQMAYFEDKSHQKIADETNIPLGTVKSRLRLALEKLRAHFAADLREGGAE